MGTIFCLAPCIVQDVYDWARQFASRLDEMEELLSGNRIWKERTVDVGIVTAQQVGDVHGGSNRSSGSSRGPNEPLNVTQVKCLVVIQCLGVIERSR